MFLFYFLSRSLVAKVLLKPRAEVTRSPKQDISGPTKRTCVRQKLIKKKFFCLSAG